MTRFRTRATHRMALAAAAMVVFATPVSAQLVPGGLPRPSLPAPVGPLIDRPLDRAVQDVRGLGRDVLAAPDRLRAVIRGSGGALEADPLGWPVVSGEIVAVGLSPAVVAEAERRGYRVLRRESLSELDLTVVVLAPPRRARLARAVSDLIDLAPEADIDFHHVYGPAGGLETPIAPSGPPRNPTQASTQPTGVVLGLIDTGVAAHPSLNDAHIRQQGIVGRVVPGAHGTAVASLLVGRAAPFSGAAPGAQLRVADVYGGLATGGSALALARGLDWITGQGVGVVNVSLVGPRNPVVARAVAQAQSRGVTVVAAAGNDGPAAPPLYPAAYPGVVGVAGVDGRRRPLPESARGPHVRYQAPGADMAAASTGGGYVSVRGSSFAAPLVAGLIAREGRDAVARAAVGGVVAADLAVTPRAVGARGTLRR